MTMHHLPFGVLLRRWRERRRLTQADLALAANSSTRHLSCLETGKSQPSRAIVNRLTELLDVPLRDRNTLLLAAGFAPAYQETSIDGLEAAKAAMDRVGAGLQGGRVRSPLQPLSASQRATVDEVLRSAELATVG